MAPSSFTSSTSTRSVRPTLAASFSPLIVAARGHETVEPVLLDIVRHGIGQRVRGRAIDRRILEAADAIEARLAQPVKQHLEVVLGLTGKADDERADEASVRADLTPPMDALERVLGLRRHASSTSARAGCRAGTECRDTAEAGLPPSVESRYRHADTGRRNAVAPTHRAAERTDSSSKRAFIGLAIPEAGARTSDRRRRRWCPARSPAIPSRPPSPGAPPLASPRRSGGLPGRRASRG